MSRLERLHHAALFGFAASLGLFEGPAEILCVVVLVTTALTGRLRNVSFSHPVLLGVLIWALAGVPGVLTSDIKVSSQGYLRPLHALAMLIGGFALRGVSERVVARMAWLFGGAMVLNGAYGILQFVVGPLPLDDALNFHKGSSQIYVPGSRTVRCASGLFYNRIRLAHVGVMGLGLLALVATTKGRPRTRVLAALGAAILGGAILLTYARTALVALAVGALVLDLLSSRPRRAALVAGGFTVLGGLVSLTAGGQRRLMESLEDLEIRGRIFGMAARIIADHPALGAGHGMYAVHARPLLEPAWSRNWIPNAHNLWLHTLAETGALGTLGFALAVGLGLVGAVRLARGATASPQNKLHRLGAIVLLTYLALGLLHHPLFHASVGLGFWFTIGWGAFGAARGQGEADE